MYFEIHQNEFIATGFLLLFLLIVRFILTRLITKIFRKNGINIARIHLINRYVSVTLFLIALIVIPFIFGTKIEQLAVLFSSVFAVIGIGLFAIWSILSNITSGIIMFFSFPYKVGDKIQIHDKDFPLEGIIEDIRAFQLHLRLENGDLVTYPNNLMLQKAVTLIEKDAIDDDAIDSI
ncbi:Low conductance mechanosensitive channel YnaI [Mariniflexile rhizosphaerae]|uniref:mechanosensitive ion channel domain-containing protein n=1 Tax=unclassified Mariniflexile TaxID=2643887 RepID=UPI000CA819E1|nr:mechanosensitive ion channel family protein [Mariniflexile sp. TRM1-10]AXP82955.1 Low conductance mechanosensitive channel YnaI [Mariniflexile sp. TRM1-10]PLB19627.1 MAG: Small-conductance mechanosensitive channel [Flavobacteriaceae bacterium FS1-H7996/R]